MILIIYLTEKIELSTKLQLKGIIEKNQLVIPFSRKKFLLVFRIHSCLSEFTGFDLAALNAVLIMAMIAVNKAIKIVMIKISTPIEIRSE